MSGTGVSEPEKIPARGSLADHRPEAVLRFCEHEHFSGTLAFDAPTGKGMFPVLDGVPEVGEGDDAKVQLAIDDFVALTEGTYELHQILPRLAVATREGDLAIVGSLGVHPVPSLMRYCESAGITGTLRCEQRGHLFDAKYRAGELVSITVDQQEDPTLEAVFGWSDGSFRIEAHPLFEPKRVSVPEPQLLSTLEVALTEIIDQRARRESAQPAASPFRAPSLRDLEGAAYGVERTGKHAAITAPSTVTASATATDPHRSIAGGNTRRNLAAAASGSDNTVKVYFVARDITASRPSLTQHAHGHGGREELDLDLPAANATTPPRPVAARADADRARDTAPVADKPFVLTPWTLAFALAAVVFVALALTFLGRLVAT